MGRNEESGVFQELETITSSELTVRVKSRGVRSISEAQEVPTCMIGWVLRWRP